MNLALAEKYFLDRVKELRSMCKDGSPWVFLCASALLNAIVNMALGKEASGSEYIDFIKKYMRKYAEFNYQDSSDLPKQMWHILRCGIVHSFSLFPDERGIGKGGRKQSILLCHRKEGLPHLSTYKTKANAEAAVFVAEDFIEDIADVVNVLFRRAADEPELRTSILTRLNGHPPIMGGF